MPNQKDDKNTQIQDPMKKKLKDDQYYDTSDKGMPAGDPGAANLEDDPDMPGGAAATTAGVLEQRHNPDEDIQIRPDSGQE